MHNLPNNLTTSAVHDLEGQPVGNIRNYVAQSRIATFATADSFKVVRAGAHKETYPRRDNEAARKRTVLQYMWDWTERNGFDDGQFLYAVGPENPDVSRGQRFHVLYMLYPQNVLTYKGFALYVLHGGETWAVRDGEVQRKFDSQRAAITVINEWSLGR